MKKCSLVAMAAVVVAVMTAGSAQAATLTANGNRVPSIAGDDTANTWAGEPYADVMGTSITIQREFRRALPSIYSYSQTAHYQDRGPTTMCAPGGKWVMWDLPFSMRDVQKPVDDYLGYTTAVSGFATGISRMIGESGAIGLAVGYDSRKLTPKDGYHFRNRADTLHIALYGGATVGNFFFDAYAGLSRSWNRMERGVSDLGNEIAINKSRYKDAVYSAGLKGSYVWTFGNDVRVTSSFGVDFSHVRLSAINEHQHSLPPVMVIPGLDESHLHSGSQGYSTLSMPLMVSANRTFGSDFLSFRGSQSLWTPEVRAGYVPVAGRKRADIDFRDRRIAKETWNTQSSQFAGSYGTVGAGMKMKLADRYIFNVDYDYTFGKKYAKHSLTAMYGFSF